MDVKRCLHLLSAVTLSLWSGWASAGTVEYLQYLESTGTQWIGTGIKPAVGHIVRLDADANKQDKFFGGYNPGGVFMGVFNNCWRLGYNLGGNTVPYSGGRHQFLIYVETTGHSKGAYYIDGNLCLEGEAIHSDSRAYRLFGVEHAWASAAATMRIYSFSITDEASGEKLIDLVPARVDGVVCMYDEVTQKPFYNDGTGSFVAGPSARFCSFTVAGNPDAYGTVSPDYGVHETSYEIGQTVTFSCPPAYTNDLETYAARATGYTLDLADGTRIVSSDLTTNVAFSAGFRDAKLTWNWTVEPIWSGAVYVWQGGTDRKFSTAANWKIEATGETATTPPGPSDMAILRSVSSSTPIEVDADFGGALSRLAVESSFKCSLQLGRDLTVGDCLQWTGTDVYQGVFKLIVNGYKVHLKRKLALAKYFNVPFEGLVFDGDQEGEIIFGDTSDITGYCQATGGNLSPRISGMTIEKPSGVKVRVSSKTGYAMFGTIADTVAPGIFIKSGVFDLSAVGVCNYSDKCTTGEQGFQLSSGAEFVAPHLMSIGYRECRFTGGPWTFNDLEMDGRDRASLYFANTTITNVVNGSLYWHETPPASGGNLLVYGDLVERPTRGWGKSLSNPSFTVILGGATSTRIVTSNACYHSFGNIDVAKGGGARVTCEGDAPLSIRGSQNGDGAARLTLRSGTLTLPPGGVQFLNGCRSGITQLDGKLEGHADVAFVGSNHTKERSNYMMMKDPIGGFRYDVPNLSAWGTVLNNGLEILADYPLVVTGLFEVVCGGFHLPAAGGYIELRGDVSIGSQAQLGGPAVRFTGSAVQHYRQEAGATNFYSTITVAKTGGRIVLDTDFDYTCRGDYSASYAEDWTSGGKYQAFDLVSGTIDANGHRFILPYCDVTVWDGFVFAVPVSGTPDVVFSTKAALTLPAAGSPVVELTGEPVPTMARRYDCWKYGTVVNPDAAWSCRVPEMVSRPKMKLDEPASVYYLSCHYRYGLRIIVK